MDVEDHAPTGCGGDDLSGTGIGEQQVERQVLPGQLGRCSCSPDVEGGVVAEPPQQGGAAGDRLVEVVAVCCIHPPADVHVPGLADVADVEVPVVGCLLPLGLGPLGVEPQHRFGDQPLELCPPDAADGRVELAVDVLSRLLGQ
ncbi:hypothetical protein [Nocardioides sp. J54]|uniref:hypothetical protein n=1 Tax=Nocardioides sp. J54 TaxID=935866 RepID=UPI00049003C9|nr:hypothetical protein [Nocardioides sp. J54]